MRRNNYSSMSWGIVILLLFLFWPVGLYLLYRKLTSKNETILFNDMELIIPVGKGYKFLGWFVIFMAVIIGLGSMSFGAFVPLVLVGGGLIYTGFLKYKKAKIFKRYLAIIDNQNTIIENIASLIPTDYEHAVKDLQEMIDKGYIPSAYIDMNRHEIIIANRKKVDMNYHAGLVYQQPVTTVPKVIVVACKSCGANNKVTEGQTCECEFCGSAVSA